MLAGDHGAKALGRGDKVEALAGDERCGGHQEGLACTDGDANENAGIDKFVCDVRDFYIGNDAAIFDLRVDAGKVALGRAVKGIDFEGLALGQVQWSNARWLLFKEIAVGGLNGLLWAVVVGAVTVFWFDTWQIALIIAAAMLVNLLAAAAVGVIVPMALRRLDIDPALSAGVILTTFTDCIGFATLLGLGALFLT